MTTRPSGSLDLVALPQMSLRDQACNVKDLLVWLRGRSLDGGDELHFSDTYFLAEALHEALGSAEAAAHTQDLLRSLAELREIVAFARYRDALGRTRDLADAFADNSAAEASTAKQLAHAEVLGWVRAQPLDYRFDELIARSVKITTALAEALEGSPPPVDDAGTSQPRASVARAAGRLARITAQLLPSSERQRYTEEFLGELWDLADAEAGSWRQTLHAIRLITRVVHLRFVLRTPHRGKASS